MSATPIPRAEPHDKRYVLGSAAVVGLWIGLGYILAYGIRRLVANHIYTRWHWAEEHLWWGDSSYALLLGLGVCLFFGMRYRAHTAYFPFRRAYKYGFWAFFVGGCCYTLWGLFLWYAFGYEPHTPQIDMTWHNIPPTITYWFGEAVGFFFSPIGWLLRGVVKAAMVAAVMAFLVAAILRHPVRKLRQYEHKLLASNHPPQGA